MKKLLALSMSALLLLTSLPLVSCNTGEEPPAVTESPNVTIIKDSASEFKIVRSDTVDNNSPEKTASLNMRNILRDATGVELTRETDWYQRNDENAKNEAEAAKEILIGHTNRSATAEAIKDLKFNEFIIKVMGHKIVICGASEAGTLQAVEYFGANYVTNGSTFELPKDLF